MIGSQGPLLSYIVRNEQQQKLAAAAQSRLAMSARPIANQRSRRIRCWGAESTVERFLRLIHQFLAGRLTGGPRRHGTWRLPQIEDSDVLDPRLSS
jgi:hypothetical protein